MEEYFVTCDVCSHEHKVGDDSKGVTPEQMSGSYVCFGCGKAISWTALKVDEEKKVEEVEE